MTNQSKTIKRLVIAIGILIVIKLAHLDTILVGENFIVTAFIILLGLGLLFISMDKKDEEIQQLRYKIHHPEIKKH